ncbi:MAG: hypothetical protein QOE58_3474 [Actinomycetota bacterium]|jgi:transcription elongation factor Elf1|nr:hypothetical protein [Actinomycetota bacterium]
MGDYATYQGQQIKTGSTGQQFNLRASQVPLLTVGALDVKFMAPSVGGGVIADRLTYRFPFPDEDGTAPGDFPPADLFRTLHIPSLTAAQAGIPTHDEHFGALVKCPAVDGAAVVSHAVKDGHLAIVVECGTCTRGYRLDTDEARAVIDAFRRKGSLLDFSDQVADRIEAGYRDPLPWAEPADPGISLAEDIANPANGLILDDPTDHSVPVGLQDSATTTPTPTPADRIAAEFPGADGNELDDWVTDHFTRAASTVNNGGPTAQIAYLLEQGESEDDIRAALQVEADSDAMAAEESR